MHIDLNSCFATIEQQANPLFRGKPLVVASHNASYGTTLAASREAKILGIKTGTRIGKAKIICPNLIVVEPDAPKYRFVHLKLKDLLSVYTPEFSPKSIDEFALDLLQSPFISKTSTFEIALDIKKRIKDEIGEWITVSIGIAPSRFLAKTAAGIRKPDGLDEINKDNYEKVYKKIPVGDLCGIGFASEPKLRSRGINTAWDLYKMSVWKLNIIFQSIHSLYWYRRLRGWDTREISPERKSFGNSFVMPRSFANPAETRPVLAKLVDKMAHRLRNAGFAACGIGVGVRFENNKHWSERRLFSQPLSLTSDIYSAAYKLLLRVPRGYPIRKVGVYCFSLIPSNSLQLKLFEDARAKQALSQALDGIKERWGIYTITSGRMIATEKYVPDRIAFGGVKELEEFTLQT